MMWVKYFPYYGTWRKKSEKERQGEKQKQQKSSLLSSTILEWGRMFEKKCLEYKNLKLEKFES